MSIFKKKIYFPQFLAKLIILQFDFLKNNFDKLIGLADEFKILTEQDKNEFIDKSHEMIIIDIMLSCNRHFYKFLSSEDISKAVSVVYGKYLLEHKKVLKTIAEDKIRNVMELFDLVSEAKQNIQEKDEHYKEIDYNSYPKIDNEIDKQKFYLVSAFCNYYAGKDMKADNWEEKRFAALKFAKAFVHGDVVANALKHYSVTFQ